MAAGNGPAAPWTRIPRRIHGSRAHARYRLDPTPNPRTLGHSGGPVHHHDAELRRPRDDLDRRARRSRRSCGSTPSRWATSSRRSAGRTSSPSFPAAGCSTASAPRRVYASASSSGRCSRCCRAPSGSCAAARGSRRRSSRCAFSWALAEAPSFPGEQSHRRAWFPAGRARHRHRHLQLGAVLRDRAVRADHGLAHAPSAGNPCST